MYYVLYIYKWLIIIDVTSFCCADYFPRLRKLRRSECECQFKHVGRRFPRDKLATLSWRLSAESVSVTTRMWSLREFYNHDKRLITRSFSLLRYASSHGSFTEISENLHSDSKIILLDHQNNYVGHSSWLIEYQNILQYNYAWVP